MATNPLFSCIKPGKRFTYNLESSKHSPLPGTYRPLQDRNIAMQGSNIQSPKAKRRRTEEEEGGWEDDDDDFMLTQENMAELDEMAQAAITGQRTCVTDPGPSIPPLSRKPVVKPQSAPAYNTSTPAGRVTFKYPMGPGVSDISLLRHSDTSSSKNSSNTTYPSSLSNSRRSTSLSSHDNSSKSAGSEEIPFQPVSRKPSLSSSSSVSSESLAVRSPISEGMREELEMYKRQCQSLQEKMDSIKQELYVKEGENKILREKLTEKDSELFVSKQQKVKLTEQQVKEQTQKEQQLKADIQRLNTQLQFKERDLAELREKCHDLETAVSAAGDTQATATHAPTTSHHSPRVVKVSVSPKARRGGFPSTKSFLADEGSQLIPPQPSNREEVLMIDAGTDMDIKDEAVKKCRRRNFLLNVHPSKGTTSGSHFLSKLSETSVLGAGLGSGPDKGLMGLLQNNSVSMDLHAFLFDRDSSKLLSPIPTKRLSDKKSAVDRPKPRPIISASSYSWAMEGLHSILSGTNQSPLISLLDVSHNNTSINQSTSSLQPQTPFVNQSGLLFLPLLNDYLSHYTEMMNCYVERGQTLLSPQSSSSSSYGPCSSSDSSIESLTSSLNILLRDGATYANNLESLALCALHVLYKLVVYCDAVRDILLTSDDLLSDSSISSFEKGEDTDADPSPSPSSSLSSGTSVSSIDRVRQSLTDSRLLSKVLRLANPGKVNSEGEGPKKYNEWVVHRALSIVRVLSEKCGEDQLPLLLPVLRKGVLSNCLKCTSTPGVVLGGVEVMCALAKHEKAVAAACTCPDLCLLLSLYQLCASPSLSQFPDDVLLEFAEKTLRCFANIGSHSKMGSSLLLDMECNSHLQRAVVLLLHKVLLLYQTNQPPEARRVLQKGALLLHNLSQVDGQFEERHYLVQYQYVELIYGLNTLFKPAPYENERCAVAELWYLGREESDSSQDDDDEMDVS